MAVNTEQSLQKEALSRAYQQKLRQREERILQQLHAAGGNLRRDGAMNALNRGVLGKLNYITYTCPSEYLADQAQWIFGDLVYPRFREAFLTMADRLKEFPYATGYARRSFRSRDYRSYTQRLLEMLLHFYNTATIDADIKDILTGRLPEEPLAWLSSRTLGHTGFPAEVLAYALDRGDEELEEIVIDILNGEGSFSSVSTPLIRGIVMSRNGRMHRQLCKLLLAARLQEGLRQSICENADWGTKEALLAIVQTIEENDLMRYSSVKRAVGTWLGLLSEEVRDLERVSSKSLQLMRRCLEDETFREECLTSEDTMAIYTALWSRAFHCTEDASVLLRQICENGTHHQLLTAGYFVANLEEPLLRHTAARLVLQQCRERYDLLAVYLPHFLPYTAQMAHRIAQSNPDGTDRYLFDTNEEAAEFCDWLFDTWQGMKKKELVFSPCIFPWFTAVLKRSDLLEKAMAIAALSGDEERIDRLCPHIAQCAPYGRAWFFAAMTQGKKTPAVRAAIVSGLTDKEEDTRRAAFVACNGLTLTPAEYMQIEDGLRLKQETLRRNLMELLLEQQDEALQATIRRLLADKKTEKRTAGLDMLTQLQKDGHPVAARCMDAVAAMVNPTTQEQLLIHALLPEEAEQSRSLFTPEDRFEPEVRVDAYVLSCVEEFMGYFPESSVQQDIRAGKRVCVAPAQTGNPCATAAAAKQHITALSEHFHNCRLEVLVSREEMERGAAMFGAAWYEQMGLSSLASKSQRWENWLEEQQLSNGQLLGMWVLCYAIDGTYPYIHSCGAYMDHLFGSGFRAVAGVKYVEQLRRILNDLVEKRFTRESLTRLGVALGTWIAVCLPEDMVFGHHALSVNGWTQKESWRYSDLTGRRTGELKQALAGNPAAHFITHPQLKVFLKALKSCGGEVGRYAYPLMLRLNREAHEAVNRYACDVLGEQVEPVELVLQDLFGLDVYVSSGPCPADPASHLYARNHGLITQRQLYYRLMQPEYLRRSLSLVTAVQAVRPEEGQTVASRCFAGYHGNILRRRYEELVTDIPSEEGKQALIDLCRVTAKEMVETVLQPELCRGDSPAEYSEYVCGIETLSGAEYFVRILKALGRDALDRTVFQWHSGSSRRGNLSYLLARCAPAQGDTAQTLAALLAGTDITRQRLIEAALFSPAWIDIIGHYLKLPGFKSVCYYFMAHMNEEFDEDKKAAIARYTPLTADELNAGAFDVDWFRSAYAELGEKEFERVYDAAKYISDGSKHARARKYADAALGKFSVQQTEDTVKDKRNKDLLMAYAIIPLTGEEDLSRRYLFIQEFIRQSRGFGAQRAASEKKAAETALRNLAINAGFSDPMRLTLRMETKLVSDNAELFAERAVKDWVFRLAVDELGTVSVECRKDGKLLKSVPAGAKKEPYVQRLTEMKKQLTEQYRRTRRMLEQAMEDSAAFTLRELRELWENPVVRPLLRALVLVSGGSPGFFDGQQLCSLAGETVCREENALLQVAHPVQLLHSGQWVAFQKHLFACRLVQPFKQVFRELYVKTADELGAYRSLRYAGHQIQPKKAAACLKERRWVADVESGLQKVYYKEELVATLYALADWFTPADIEAPTLEYVAFFHRRTGEPVKLDNVPEVIFSEVMRDVDLAVSVAHVGGVDPETSHSTVEMRAALVEFTLPLLGLTNVKLQGNHAVIRGTLAEYAVHLGSGVVHQLGGAMLSILPVHSQHRGRLFLPFLDDDPKTAEILSKILLLSEDKKLKDPSILTQITRDEP